MLFRRFLVSLYILLFVSGVLLIHYAPSIAVETDIEKAFLRELAREYHVQRGFPIFVYVAGPEAKPRLDQQITDTRRLGMNTDEYMMSHVAIDAGVTCVTMSADKKTFLFGHLVINHEGWVTYAWDPRGEELLCKFGIFHDHAEMVTLANSFVVNVEDLNLGALRMGSNEEPRLAGLEDMLSRLSPTASSPKFVFGKSFATDFRNRQIIRLYAAKSAGLIMVILGLIGISVWLSQTMTESRQRKPRRFRKDRADEDSSAEYRECISGVEELYPLRELQIGNDGRFERFDRYPVVAQEETEEQRRDRRIDEFRKRYYVLQEKRREPSREAGLLFREANDESLPYRERRKLYTQAIDEAKKPEKVIEEAAPPSRASQLEELRDLRGHN